MRGTAAALHGNSAGAVALEGDDNFIQLLTLGAELYEAVEYFEFAPQVRGFHTLRLVCAPQVIRPLNLSKEVVEPHLSEMRARMELATEPAAFALRDAEGGLLRNGD